MEKIINFLNYNELFKTYENIEKNILNEKEFKNELLLQIKNNIIKYPFIFNKNNENNNEYILENKNYDDNFFIYFLPNRKFTNNNNK